MRGQVNQQPSMLMLMSPESLVPAAHPIRRVKTLADDALRALSPVFDQIYAQAYQPLSRDEITRAPNPDPALIGFNNADQYPGAKSPVAVADDGNLNYRKGDVVSAPVSWLTDFELRWRNQYGLFVRARAWYDYELNKGGVPHGHMNNGFVPGARLSDANMYSAEQFDGIQRPCATVRGFP